jgi:hypothetical protein
LGRTAQGGSNAFLRRVKVKTVDPTASQFVCPSQALTCANSEEPRMWDQLGTRTSRSQPESAGLHAQRWTHETPESRSEGHFAHLGVKGSQVQILSARPIGSELLCAGQDTDWAPHHLVTMAAAQRTPADRAHRPCGRAAQRRTLRTRGRRPAARRATPRLPRGGLRRRRPTSSPERATHGNGLMMVRSVVLEKSLTFRVANW